MWVIAKYNSKQFNLLKDNFRKVLGKTIHFYHPKIKYQKFIKQKLKTYEKYILGNYLICYDEKFNDNKVINQLKHSKGLSYFLNGFKNNQKEIINFVNYCKKNESSDGCLNQDFFENKNFTKARFISGPFTNMVFEIISKQKKDLKILIGGMITTINKKSNYLYRPI